MQLGLEDFTDEGSSLFGNNFQSSLTGKVQKEAALSKAVAIMK